MHWLLVIGYTLLHLFNLLYVCPLLDAGTHALPLCKESEVVACKSTQFLWLDYIPIVIFASNVCLLISNHKRHKMQKRKDKKHFWIPLSFLCLFQREKLCKIAMGIFILCVDTLSLLGIEKKVIWSEMFKTRIKRPALFLGVAQILDYVFLHLLVHQCHSPCQNVHQDVQSG